jgi:HEAT repeats
MKRWSSAMQSRLRTVCISFALATGFAPQLSAGPVRPATLGELIDVSDVVVIGRVKQILDLGPTNITGPGSRAVPGRAFEAQIAVAEWLKGSAKGESLSCRFALPDISNGYQGLQKPGTIALFLNERTDHYELAMPFYAAIPVALVTMAPELSTADKLVNALGALLESPNRLRDDRLEAVEWLSTANTPAARAILRNALMSADTDVQLRSAGALLRSDDISGLPLIERALLRQSGGQEVSSDTRLQLVGALARGVRTESAVPSLSRLISSEDVQTRRAAVASLRMIRSLRAIPSLIRTLEDPDLEVQYTAVMGLAELTGDASAAPSLALFKQDPSRYLNYWRAWAKSAKL